MHANFLKSNRRQAFINKYLPPNYLIISFYFACYLLFSMAACATFIYDYSPIGYIAGVCEVYALWYDFFLKLLLS